MHPPYELHLDPYVLRIGRGFINRLGPDFDNSGAANAHRKVEHWRRQATDHLSNFNRSFESGGPAEVASNHQRVLGISFLTLCAELHTLILEGFSLSNACVVDVYGDAQEHFDKQIAEVLNELAAVVEKLRTRWKAKSLPHYRRDHRGDALQGRLENLSAARHLCALALRVCRPEGDMPHEQLKRWLGLSAIVYRNYSEAIIDRAKELESEKRSVS